MERKIAPSALVLDGPHEPAGGDHGADEDDEGEGTEADHQARAGALGDAEDDRGEEGEEQGSAEVREHYSAAFLPLAKEWASTAAMMLSRPAAMRNLVP